MRKANSAKHAVTREPRARGPLFAVRCSLLALALAAGTVRAQQTNPVYTDDSPVARDTLARVDEFVASGNEAEAVRELQRLLDEQPDRVVRSATSGETFVSVRARAHAVLLASP